MAEYNNDIFITSRYNRSIFGFGSEFSKSASINNKCDNQQFNNNSIKSERFDGQFIGKTILPIEPILKIDNDQININDLIKPSKKPTIAIESFKFKSYNPEPLIIKNFNSVINVDPSSTINEKIIKCFNS